MSYRRLFPCKYLLRYQRNKLRWDFFELWTLHGQKDHNNLLPLVKFRWNHVCFAPGNDFDGRFDHFDSYKVLFPLLISNLCRKDMKHFVVEKPQGCKWKICFSRLAMRCQQCWLFVREVMADSDGSRQFTFEISCQINSLKVCNCFTSIT